MFSSRHGLLLGSKRKRCGSFPHMIGETDFHFIDIKSRGQFLYLPLSAVSGGRFATAAEYHLTEVARERNFASQFWITPKQLQRHFSGGSVLSHETNNGVDVGMGSGPIVLYNLDDIEPSDVALFLRSFPLGAPGGSSTSLADILGSSSSSSSFSAIPGGGGTQSSHYGCYGVPYGRHRIFDGLKWQRHRSQDLSATLDALLDLYMKENLLVGSNWVHKTVVEDRKMLVLPGRKPRYVKETLLQLHINNNDNNNTNGMNGIDNTSSSSSRGGGGGRGQPLGEQLQKPDMSSLDEDFDLSRDAVPMMVTQSPTTTMTASSHASSFAGDNNMTTNEAQTTNTTNKNNTMPPCFFNSSVNAVATIMFNAAQTDRFEEIERLWHGRVPEEDTCAGFRNPHLTALSQSPKFRIEFPSTSSSSATATTANHPSPTEHQHSTSNGNANNHNYCGSHKQIDDITRRLTQSAQQQLPPESVLPQAQRPQRVPFDDGSAQQQHQQLVAGQEEDDISILFSSSSTHHNAAPDPLLVERRTRAAVKTAQAFVDSHRVDTSYYHDGGEEEEVEEPALATTASSVSTAAAAAGTASSQYGGHHHHNHFEQQQYHDGRISSPGAVGTVMRNGVSSPPSTTTINNSATAAAASSSPASHVVPSSTAPMSGSTSTSTASVGVKQHREDIRALPPLPANIRRQLLGKDDEHPEQQQQSIGQDRSVTVNNQNQIQRHLTSTSAAATFLESNNNGGHTSPDVRDQRGTPPLHQQEQTQQLNTDLVGMVKLLHNNKSGGGNERASDVLFSAHSSRRCVLPKLNEADFNWSGALD